MKEEDRLKEGRKKKWLDRRQIGEERMKMERREKIEEKQSLDMYILRNT